MGRGRDRDFQGLRKPCCLGNTLQSYLPPPSANLGEEGGSWWQSEPRSQLDQWHRLWAFPCKCSELENVQPPIIFSWVWLFAFLSLASFSPGLLSYQSIWFLWDVWSYLLFWKVLPCGGHVVTKVAPKRREATSRPLKLPTRSSRSFGWWLWPQHDSYKCLFIR